MVKDKHAKAVAFMAKMQFNDSCIGYDAGAKKCKCLVKFLEKKVSLMDAKNYFSNISLQLWNGIGDDDDEDMMIQKVVDFLNPFHVVKNGKENIFEFHVSKDQSSVTEKNGNLPSNNMQIFRNSQTHWTVC